MAKKSNAPRQLTSTGTALAFGGTTKAVSLPSGSKLLFDEPDQDGVIKYLGQKDISDKVGRDPGEVIYLIGHDGKRTVSIPMSYQLKETKLESGHYYYLHLADLVQVKKDFNSMKDFNVVDLGVEGESAPVTSDRLPGIKAIDLTLDSIRELNYTMLNYPLRKV